MLDTCKRLSRIQVRGVLIGGMRCVSNHIVLKCDITWILGFWASYKPSFCGPSYEVLLFVSRFVN